MENKKNFPILYVRYEDLISDKRNQISRIIDFLEVDVAEDAIERALHYSSFEYMKENENLFGDQPPENKKVYDQFIRKGKSGEGKEQFDESQSKTFHYFFEKMVRDVEDKTFGKSL